MGATPLQLSCPPHPSAPLLQFQARGEAVPVLVTNFLVILRALSVVVVQDALELAPRYPNHPVHISLMRLPKFRELLKDYEDKMAQGVRWARATPDECWPAVSPHPCTGVLHSPTLQALRPPPNFQESVQLNMQLQAAMARVMTTGQGHKELQDSNANIEQDLAMMATVRQDQNQVGRAGWWRQLLDHVGA